MTTTIAYDPDGPFQSRMVPVAPSRDTLIVGVSMDITPDRAKKMHAGDQ